MVLHHFPEFLTEAAQLLQVSMLTASQADRTQVYALAWYLLQQACSDALAALHEEQ